MKTRIEEVEEMLNRVDEELYGELHTNQYGGVCVCSIEDLIDEKVKLEVEKYKLSH